MAQGKQVVYTPVDISDGEYSDFEPDAKMEEENAEFEAFKSEMQDAQFDAKITVGKKLTDSTGRPMGRQIFECFECSIDDYTFSQLCTRIREDFGTGLYQVQGRDSKGKYKFKRTVGILAPNSIDNAPAGNDAAHLIDKFSDAMQRQQMATEQMFLKIAGPQNNVDMVEQIVKVATAVTPLLAAFGITRPAAAPPKTLIEQLTEMKMVQELMGGDNDVQHGEANGWSALTSALTALGPALGTALAMGATSDPAPVVEAAPRLDAPPEIDDTELTGQAPPTHEQFLANQKRMDMERAALTKQIGLLLIQAKGGAEPKAVAEMVVKMTPDDKQDQLWDTILPDDCIEKMAAAVPEVHEHLVWFENLRAEILDIMGETETSEDEFPPPDDEVNEDNENLTGGRTPVQDAASDAVAGADSLPDAPSENGDPPINP